MNDNILTQEEINALLQTEEELEPKSHLKTNLQAVVINTENVYINTWQVGDLIPMNINKSINIHINNNLVAQGKIEILNDIFGLRLTKIESKKGSPP
jgi:flagellar motor switch/type III secretory pathway protein FliN